MLRGLLVAFAAVVVACSAAPLPVAPQVAVVAAHPAPEVAEPSPPPPPPPELCDGVECASLGLRDAAELEAVFGADVRARDLADMHTSSPQPSPHGSVSFVHDRPPPSVGDRVVPGMPLRAIVTLDAPASSYPGNYRVELAVDLEAPHHRPRRERCETFPLDGATKESAALMLARELDLVLVTSGDDGNALALGSTCVRKLRAAMFDEGRSAAVALDVSVSVVEPQEQTLASGRIVIDVDKGALERTVALDKAIDSKLHRAPDRRMPASKSPSNDAALLAATKRWLASHDRTEFQALRASAAFVPDMEDFWKGEHAKAIVAFKRPDGTCFLEPLDYERNPDGGFSLDDFPARADGDAILCANVTK